VKGEDVGVGVVGGFEGVAGDEVDSEYPLVGGVVPEGVVVCAVEDCGVAGEVSIVRSSRSSSWWMWVAVTVREPLCFPVSGSAA
jgi:hypothetical protein